MDIINLFDRETLDTIEPGFYRIPDRLYHNGIGENQSLLKTIVGPKGSPAHYLHKKQNPTMPTAAMKLGTMAHVAFLEPESFSELYICRPPGTERNKIEGIAAYVEWAQKDLGLPEDFDDSGTVKEINARLKEWEKTKNPDLREPITQEERNTAYSIALALSDHPVVNRMMEGAEIEIGLYDLIQGRLCRGKTDILRFDKDIIFDLKTGRDASPKGVERSIHLMGYDFQAAMYSDLYAQLTGRFPQYIIISVESSPPFGITLHHVGDEWIRKGRAKYKKALNILDRCEETGEWPCYDEAIISSQPAPWMLAEDEA